MIEVVMQVLFSKGTMNGRQGKPGHVACCIDQAQSVASVAQHVEGTVVVYLAQVDGEDQTTMDSLDEEVRADVEAAAKILSRRLASRCLT